MIVVDDSGPLHYLILLEHIELLRRFYGQVLVPEPVAAWLIAQRGVNALVLVHRRQLLDQWVERLSTFLDIPAKSIGRIGGGRSRTTGTIDVGIIQSLVRNGLVADVVADYGHVIIDECHYLSAHSFEQVARQAKARYHGPRALRRFALGHALAHAVSTDLCNEGSRGDRRGPDTRRPCGSP